jgi:hypothetical protein
MSMADSLSSLPYYREYVEQILRPRVGRMVEELRANLTEQVWGALVERLAHDQNKGAAPDPQALDKLKAMLTETLGLRLNVQLNAEFAGAAPQTAAPAAPVNNAPDVVERTFPNNPLARAVGGVRAAGR